MGDNGSMYIGVGTVVLILLIVLILWLVFGRSRRV
jgi:cbb3-type cytochrome oxidase subunit 3